MVTFKHTQLKNGMDIVAEINPEAQSVAIGFMVKTGARDESGEVYGVSHFLEHMMFKGTSRRSSANCSTMLSGSDSAIASKARPICT